MEEPLFPVKEKFMNPYTDAGFKRIFGSEISKKLIIKFLNSLLNESIVDITFRNVEALGSSNRPLSPKSGWSVSQMRRVVTKPERNNIAGIMQ